MGGKDLRLVIIGIFITNEYTSTRGQESPALIHHRRRNSQGPLSSLPLTTHSRALHRSPPQAFHPKLSHQLSNLFIPSQDHTTGFNGCPITHQELCTHLHFPDISFSLDLPLSRIWTESLCRNLN